jgi:hypothetical protein
VQTCCAGVCCRDFESCSNGQCVPPDINICFIADTDCADGRRCCKNLFGQGLACRDLSSDRFNCGACNRFCIEPGRSCCNGVCCADAACCGGTCRDLAGDPRHCGACGTACQGKQDCVDGGCVCQAPNIICGGECVDPRRDKRHCNGCNQTCGTLEGCCDSVCRNLTNDPDHCGGCDRGCNGQPCQEGECVGCGGPGAFCGAERPPCCSGQCNVEPGNNFGECG